MKKGYLSQYFDGVAIKVMTAVEADVLKSNQHEFNGVESLRTLLGEPDGKVRYKARFIYLTDAQDNPTAEDGFLTWYDARQKARLERGVQRSEYRLYFPDNLPLQAAGAGDLLVIARQPGNELLAIVVERDSTLFRQVEWLFGAPSETHPGFSVRDCLDTERDRIAFASRTILETIGIFVDDTEDIYLDLMLDRFAGVFPATRVFSAYARSTLPAIHATDGEDDALLAWLEREELLFRTFEKHLIGGRLSQGFSQDVDGFLAFSLSVHNRRKSRVGLALENHIEFIFAELGIRYARSARTENKSRPDFIFPGEREYHDRTFDRKCLTMLGVKSTCKDRWRQVLAEAADVREKHLLTLEAPISTGQTDEMKAKSLQLVVPQGLHATFSADQQAWLMNLERFLTLVKERQQR